MKLKTQLNLLVVISIVGFLMIGFIGQFFSNRNENLLTNFIHEGEQIEQLINNTRFAQVSFQRQVQEWKNILIRGNNDESYQKYLKDFNAKESLVQEKLNSLKGEMIILKLDTLPLEKLIQDHKELGVKYRTALASFDQKNPESGKIVDKLVKGIDRDTSSGLDNLTTYIEKQSQEKFIALKEKSEDGNRNKNIALLSFFIIGLSFVIVFSQIIKKKIYAQLGCEPEYAKEIANQIANGTIHSIKIINTSNNSDNLISSIEKMHNHLKLIVDEITNCSKSIHNYSDSLYSSIQNISKSSLSQAETTASSASSVEEFTVSIEQVTDNAHVMDDKAKEANKLSIHGAESFKKVSKEIDNVNNSIDVTANDVKLLSQQVNSIEKVLLTIKEVADQTNLLALNAAIEAARAGQYGDGFAVVAKEVRSLANKTTQSLSEISGVISSIQNGTKQSVSNIEKNKVLIEKAKDEAESASIDITKITDTNQVVIRVVQDVLDSLKEQKYASQEIAKSIENIAQNAENNFNSVNNIQDTTRNLQSAAIQLESSIAHFNK